LVPRFDKERLRQLPTAAIRHVLQENRVHVLNTRVRPKEEIDASIRILSGDSAYTVENRALLAEFSVKRYDTDAVKKLARMTEEEYRYQGISL
jgi:hypothetical protein